MKEVNVVLSPCEDLPVCDVWLVVDILRATSNIVNFFDLGGKILIPVREVEEAREIRTRMGDKWLLMGERNMIAPEGFDFGNSPLEYTESDLRRSPYAVLTTSNGTFALSRVVRTGKPVFVACARNASAVAKRAMSSADSIGILCSGRSRKSALDDIVCSGLIVSRLLGRDPQLALSDGSKVSLEMWENCFGNLQRGVEMASHARLLTEAGLEKDISFCCQIDMTERVPRMTEWEGHTALGGF